MRQAYLKLIDDTLAYLRPQEKEEVPAPRPPKTAPAPTTAPEKKEKKEKEPTLTFDPPTIPVSSSQDKWRTLLKTVAPDLYLHETIPSDEGAKRIKEAWKEKHATPAVPILYQGGHYHSFLSHLAKAIETRFFSSRIVDTSHQWDLFLASPQLKLIIAPDHVIFGSKELLPLYKEHPQQKSRFLGDVPLLLLPDLSLYFKDPYLKRALWNVICQMLMSPSS